MKKQIIIYKGKSGLRKTDWTHKKLADFAVNIGSNKGCVLNCTYCSTQAIHMHPEARALYKKMKSNGDSIENLAFYRSKDNVLETVNESLKKIKKNDTRIVVFCTAVDPCATLEHVETTIEAIRLIMEKSDLQVRILSKSILIQKVAEAISIYKDRIVFGLSTGVYSDEIRMAIESNASSVDSRLNVLHWLQNNGFRTFGMICPVLPSELDKIGLLLDRIRPEKCEGVWVEMLNNRCRSYLKTKKALEDAGLKTDAKAIDELIGNTRKQTKYAEKLFSGFQKEMLSRGLLEKLNFLQYVSKDNVEFFEKNKNKGAICL